MNPSVVQTNPALCVECDLCSLACTQAHAGVLDAKTARVRIFRHWPEAPGINICRHWQCEGQPCIASCPTMAIELREGVLIIDPTACNGCGECVGVCPYGALFISEDWQAVACDLCGGAPACIPACPTAALFLED
ncbi:MAG: 4Fe-4S binding protein [Anaerolineales bacterium]|nr:4Fe-4S binding protein [Anaerolineales bacterium]